MCDIHEITNFVSTETCTNIIKEMSNTPIRRNSETQPFFWNRTRSIDSFPCKDELYKIQDKMLHVAKLLYGVEDLVVDYIDVVTWNDGQEMKPHSDSHDVVTGKPYHYCHRRIYSGVLYLNDDYEGGETYFPNHGILVTPKTGKFVLFPSNVEYMHGVKQVHTNTHRYTLPIWFRR